MAAVRNAFGFVFTMTVAGLLLIVTGLIGFYPPAHMSLDPATWRRGQWNDEILLPQLAIGVVLLAVAWVGAVRVNRRLTHGR